MSPDLKVRSIFDHADGEGDDDDDDDDDDDGWDHWFLRFAYNYKQNEEIDGLGDHHHHHPHHQHHQIWYRSHLKLRAQSLINS